MKFSAITATHVIPNGAKLLVRWNAPEQAEVKTEGGLYIAKTLEASPHRTLVIGEVLNVGPGDILYDGSLRECTYDLGHNVVFFEDEATVLNTDDQDMRVYPLVGLIEDVAVLGKYLEVDGGGRGWLARDARNLL